MPSNSNELRQNAQGRWDLTIRHDKPGITIPARLTYEDQPENINITNTTQTINTRWYTDLGVAIDVDAIDKYAQPVDKDGKTYVVTRWDISRPIPWTGDPGTTSFRLRVSPVSSSIESAGTIQLYAYYEELSGSTVVDQTDVTNNASCSWSTSNSNVATVSSGLVSGKNKNSGSSQTARITANYNGYNGTSEITVAKASGTTPSGPQLALSGSSNSMSKTGGEITLSITSNTGWTLAINSEAVSYASINNTTGNNNGTRRLTIDPNSTNNTRTVRVTASTTGSGSITRTWEVTQERSGSTPSGETRYEVLITPLTSTDISSAGTATLKAEFLTYVGSSTVPADRLDVTSSPNCTWESNKVTVATVSAGVVTADNQTYEEQVVQIKATYNAGQEIGSYYDTQSVTVAPKAGGAPETYYALVVTPTAATIDYDGNAQLTATLYTYQANNPNPVGTETVTTSSTWSTNNQLVGVSDDRLSKGKVQGYNNGSGETTATITAEYQKGYSSYTGTSIITCQGRNIDIDIDTTPVYAECSELFSFTRHIEAESSVTWSVSVVDVEHIGSDVDWVEASPATGAGSGDVTITVKQENTGKTTRDCFVWIYYPKGSNTRKSINVTQYPTPRFNLQARTITVPQLGSTEYITVDTNYPLTLDNSGNTWITMSQSATSNGYKAIITTSEASSQRSGTVYIGSEYSGECADFSPVAITINQEYAPPTPPVQNGYVYVYETESSQAVSALTYNRSAAEQIVEFYIETNANCFVSAITCTSVCGQTNALRVTETNGYDLTNGATIVPTGTGNKRKLQVHLPENQYTWSEYDRTFGIRIITSGNASHHVVVTIHQRHNEYYESGYTMMFMYNNDLGQDEVTIDSSARYIKPFVRINTLRVYTAGYSSETQVTNYIDNSGIDDTKMQLSINRSDVVPSRDHTHDGAYIATLDYPYEIYIPANETFDTSGSPRDIILTLTYTGTGGTVQKTLTIHQRWAQKQLEEVNMHILSGGGLVPTIQVDTAYAIAQSGQVITVESNAGSVYVTGEAGVTLIIGGEMSKFDVGGDMAYGVPYDLGNSNGKAIYLTSKSNSHYTITINCSKSQKATKILTISVND